MFNADDLPRSLTIQQAKLGTLRGLFIEKRCPCGASCVAATDGLIERHGSEVIVSQFVPRLSCKQCPRSGHEMAIYLMEGMHREPCGGPPPSWSLPLHRMRPDPTQ